MDNLPMALSAQQSLKLMRQQGMISRKLERKVLKFLRSGKPVKRNDPLAPVLQAVWMVQLAPGNYLLH